MDDVGVVAALLVELAKIVRNNKVIGLAWEHN